MSTASTNLSGPGTALPRRLAGEDAKRILIVDDAQFLGVGLQRALRSAGFESHCVTSGARALESLTYRCFDVVLTDLRMPEMSGEQLLEVLHRERPGLPCIVMTGYATRETVTCVARMPNVLGILVKPIEYNKLFSVLARAVAQPDAPSVKVAAE